MPILGAVSSEEPSSNILRPARFAETFPHIMSVHLASRGFGNTTNGPPRIGQKSRASLFPQDLFFPKFSQTNRGKGTNKARTATLIFKNENPQHHNLIVDEFHRAPKKNESQPLKQAIQIYTGNVNQNSGGVMRKAFLPWRFQSVVGDNDQRAGSATSDKSTNRHTNGMICNHTNSPTLTAKCHTCPPHHMFFAEITRQIKIKNKVGS